MKKKVAILILTLFLSKNLICQKANDSIFIESKKWNKDDKKEVVYSNWRTVGCKTVDNLENFTQSEKTNTDIYGGFVDKSIASKNESRYFQCQLTNGRWWVIDPVGNPFLSMAVNGVRTGNSANNESALENKFGSKVKWTSETIELLKNIGFNGTGSWSDIESILLFNATHPNPISYTVQLSLCGSFSHLQKKKSEHYPKLANVFNPEFKIHCITKMKDFEQLKTDNNLFGYFSDNELPLQENLLKDFISINDPSDIAYQIAVKWVEDYSIKDLNQIDKSVKNLFSGFVADIYFKTVREAIKSADRNHLYLGSRLHASAKNVNEVLAAAEKYNDIISINYYGHWALTEKHAEQYNKLKKPFLITEFYTKAEDTKMPNLSGAGWLVKTQNDRGLHYQNFCITLLRNKNCVGWHWFRYQDNDPDDKSSDASNNDSNKGIVDTQYNEYKDLTERMKQLNESAFKIIKYFDK